MTDAIPVTLIGGYLGAGKTTLVNHLLRNAGGRRLAVLVNEFGELPIDADLIEARDGNVIAIAGGCICCSFGSDLVAALLQMRERSAAIDHLLIETSGVALPQSIVQSLTLLPGLALDGVIIVADAETILERARDRYMSDTVLRQLTDADIVLLNKTDLISRGQLDTTMQWLAKTQPAVRVVAVRNADVPLEITIGLHPRRETDSVRMPRLSSLGHQTDGYQTLTFEIDTPCDPELLARDLAEPELGVLRAKGFLRRFDGGFAALQIVGRRWLVEPAPSWIDGPGRVVCIGLKASMHRAAVQSAIDRGQNSRYQSDLR
jgi:G3E family GTPase